jgi:hypothetical protein
MDFRTVNDGRAHARCCVYQRVTAGAIHETVNVQMGFRSHIDGSKQPNACLQDNHIMNLFEPAISVDLTVKDLVQ